MSDRPTPAVVKICEDPETTEIPQTGAVTSVQRAEVEMPAEQLEQMWKHEYLERLGRAYWAYLSRISLHLLRVVYEPEARTVVFLFRPFALLRFHAPEYEADAERGSVTWKIDRGLLVARQGHDSGGFLRIAVERAGDGPDGTARLGVQAEVQNFYPWLRGSGRFARLGTWLYGRTQVRIHAIVTNGFLRSLARLDLPPSRVGALRAEIEGGPAGGDAV